MSPRADYHAGTVRIPILRTQVVAWVPWTGGMPVRMQPPCLVPEVGISGEMTDVYVGCRPSDLAFKAAVHVASTWSPAISADFDRREITWKECNILIEF